MTDFSSGGFLNIDKPAGMTSRDVVNIVMGRLRVEQPAAFARRRGQPKLKVGHAGTLDPLATGVLVVGVGPAVRLISYVQQMPKRYRATFQLNRSSPTVDLEGELTEHDLPLPDAAALGEAAKGLVGRIEQTPPAYSAVKIDGRRSYALARAGIDVDVPVRVVQVHQLEVTRFESDSFDLDLTCGSGTYVRSLGLDLAVACGNVAVMSRLRRVSIGSFDIDHAISVDRVREGPLGDALMPTEIGTRHLGRVVVSESVATQIGHGRSIPLTQLGSRSDAGDDPVAAVNESDDLIGILVRRGNHWHPRLVLPRRHRPARDGSE